MANTWILIRHPDKEGDADGLYLGDQAQITEKGQQQIPHVISRLRVLFPDAVTSSMFPRAVALAERIAAELKIEAISKVDLFNEIDKPRFLIGLKRTDPLHVEVMQGIRDSFDDDTVPTHLLRGEKIRSRSELEEQVHNTLLFAQTFQPDSMLPPPSTLLTVSHAKKIAAIVHYVYRGDGMLKGYYQMADRALRLGTTGITILKREPNRRTGEMQWHIQTLNEEAHIEFGAFDELNQLIKSVP